MRSRPRSTSFRPATAISEAISIAPTMTPLRIPGLPGLIGGAMSIILSGALILLRAPNYPASPALSVRCGAQLAQTVKTLG
jgi:hypothetical protein